MDPVLNIWCVIFNNVSWNFEIKDLRYRRYIDDDYRYRGKNEFPMDHMKAYHFKHRLLSLHEFKYFHYSVTLSSTETERIFWWLLRPWYYQYQDLWSWFQKYKLKDKKDLKFWFLSLKLMSRSVLVHLASNASLVHLAVHSLCTACTRIQLSAIQMHQETKGSAVQFLPKVSNT